MDSNKISIGFRLQYFMEDPDFQRVRIKWMFGNRYSLYRVKNWTIIIADCRKPGRFDLRIRQDNFKVLSKCYGEDPIIHNRNLALAFYLRFLESGEGS